MAETIYLQSDGLPLGSGVRRAGLRIGAVAGLLLALAGARQHAHELHLRHELAGRRPSAEAIAWGLRQAQEGHVAEALRALDRQPPERYAHLLAAAPLGSGRPLDRLAPRLLRRRSDAPSRAGLARLGLARRGR